ncbi:unnamed protein product [Mycena citricolor]|uniref:Uncharacterized protein n=1 Tax=Mycena citricolor TaxID=2018698 RepID=A0AAD2H8V7_9AGAR|nr:unnamed protein product [Mycena citricolor]
MHHKTKFSYLLSHLLDLFNTASQSFILLFGEDHSGRVRRAFRNRHLVELLTVLTRRRQKLAENSGSVLLQFHVRRVV